MDEQSVILIYNSCRLCLQQEGKYNVFLTHNLSEDICTWTNIKIKPDDGLPQSICKQCMEIINNIRVLRELALCNESRLRVFMLNNENKDKDINVIDTAEKSTDSVTIDQSCNGILNNTNLSDKIKIYDDRGQQSEDNNDFLNLEIIEDGIKLEDDIQVDDNILSIHDSMLQIQPPSSSGLAVRKDLFSTELVTHYPKLPNETSQISTDNDSNNTVDTPKYDNVKAEIDGVFKCMICDKLYESRKKWYHHQRTHNKSFSCPIPLCSKKFANRGDVEKHVRVHTGERPYECEVCLKKFTQRCSLKIHKETLHTDLVT